MRVLSIIHGMNARSGVFAEQAEADGHEIEERSFALGNPPEDPEGYDAVLVLGGAMNVHEVDDHPWLPEEQRALERVLAAGVPALGVCLGSQLIASVAGGQVTRAPEPEIGWFEVERTPAGADDPLFGALPERFAAYQWHSYQSDLPPGATPLATSPVCLQGYRLGDAVWGTQFHAEVTKAICESWIDKFDTDPDAVRQGFDPEAERARVEREIARWNELGRRLMHAFLAVAAARAGAVPARAGA